MIYYHGSVIPNLKTLYPMFTPYSNAGKSCIYLTSRSELTVLYLWVRKFMWLTYGFDKSTNKVIYTESFDGCLEEFYSNVKGYIYSSEIEEDVENKANINSAITYYKPLEVTKCEVIEDAYERIMKYEKEGKMIIHRFKDLTDQEIKSNYRMIKGAINNLNLLNGKHPLSSFVERKFPEIWEECYKIEKTTNI